MLSRSSARGFTIIEMLVGLTIIALLVGLGAPALGVWLNNSKIGNTTQELFAALQSARTEAIRRNVPVDFVLTDTAVTTADLANALAQSASGVNWVVRAASDVSSAPRSLVSSRAGREGANESNASAMPVAIAGTGTAGFNGIVSFNGFGGTVDGAGYSFAISNPAAGTCVASGGEIRCRRIVVTPGGRITACDPAAAAGDSRACPP